ncbi:hypothetical protein ACFQWH_23210 [Mycolicibacterium sp. GCM10028919]
MFDRSGGDEFVDPGGFGLHEWCGVGGSWKHRGEDEESHELSIFLSW